MSFQAPQEGDQQYFSRRQERIGSHQDFQSSNHQSPQFPVPFMSSNATSSSQQQYSQMRDFLSPSNMAFQPKPNYSPFQNMGSMAVPSSHFDSFGVRATCENLNSITVTVIPLEAHLNPYSMVVDVKPDLEKNLKQVFSHQKYWSQVFQNHSPLLPPHYRVFKTSVSDYTHKFPFFKGLKLQILSLKCEGYQFPKNPNALPIEQYCKQHFFGPLVVALQTETAPPVLKSFLPEFLENLRSINEEEGRNYPAPPIPSILNNPAYLPNIGQNSIQLIDIHQMALNLQQVCINSINETFQKRLERYLKAIDPVMFYLYRYKTTFCANKSKDHDWNHCVYAHKPFDFRRPPDTFFYQPEKCKNYNQETGTGCTDDCQFSHTTFERLYHPHQYKTNICQQFGKKRKTCQKDQLCAFVHYDFELRHIPTCDKLFLFDRLKLSSKQYDSWQLELNLLQPLPEVTEEERKYFLRISEQQQASKLQEATSQQSSICSFQANRSNMHSQMSLNIGSSNQTIFSDLTFNDSKNFNLKSIEFTPSYKKPQSCNGKADTDKSLQIRELQIDQISLLDNIDIIQPKSPLRHQSSSTNNLHKAGNLIEEAKQGEDENENEMIEVLMSNNLIRYNDESQSRTSSRFQQMFDRLDHNHHYGGGSNQSRKYTGNSYMFTNEEGTASDGGRDIFTMNIPINYARDQQSDF